MPLPKNFFSYQICSLFPRKIQENGKEHMDKIPLAYKQTAESLSTTTATLIHFLREVYTPSAHLAPGIAVHASDCQ
jgi:hypothetical protein